MTRTKSLVFWHRGPAGWIQIPDWANYFLELGSIVSRGPERAVITITTPIRAFTSALCVTGVVVDRYNSFTPPASNSTKHLAQLRRLPIGSRVSFRPGGDNSKIGWGTLEGLEIIDGREYIVIRIPGRETRKMPASMADRIVPIDSPHEVQAGPARYINLERVTGLMSALPIAANPAALIPSSRLECVVIGNRNVLREEIVEAPFAVSTDDKERYRGYLQDLVRARSYLQGGEFPHSDILSVASRTPLARLATNPRIVIYDGARSFLKWKESFPSAKWVVVLERGDRRLVEAGAAIDALYISRNAGHAAISLSPPPIGIECAAFVRRKGAA